MEQEHKEIWTMMDETEAKHMQIRYGDRSALGDEWLEKRKLADAARGKLDGKPNPQYRALIIEEEIARLKYDMAYMLEANRILLTQNEIYSSMFQRIGLLEGAYAYLKSLADDTKMKYLEKLMRLGSKNSIDN